MWSTSIANAATVGTPVRGLIIPPAGMEATQRRGPSSDVTMPRIGPMACSADATSPTSVAGEETNLYLWGVGTTVLADSTSSVIPSLDDAVRKFDWTGEQ